MLRPNFRSLYPSNSTVNITESEEPLAPQNTQVSYQTMIRDGDIGNNHDLSPPCNVDGAADGGDNAAASLVTGAQPASTEETFSTPDPPIPPGRSDRPQNNISDTSNPAQPNLSGPAHPPLPKQRKFRGRDSKFRIWLRGLMRFGRRGE